LRTNSGTPDQIVHAAVLIVLWLVASVVVIFFSIRRKRMMTLASLYAWSWLLVLWLDDIPVTSLPEANLLFWMTAVDAIINAGCLVMFITICVSSWVVSS